MQKSILFSLLFFSIQIIAPPILAQPIRKTAKPISWQKRAKADLASIKKVLQENHPGAVDEGSNNIKKWLADSKKQLAERLPLVADEASYKALLSWYVCGFQDGLTSIKFALGLNH